MSIHEEMIAADGLQYEVRNYRKRNQYSWNWSCQVCGDSAINQRKARFWVDKKSQSLVCHCFNCGYSASFISYIKDYHQNSYEAYRRAVMSEVMEDFAPTLYDLDKLFDRKGITDDTLRRLFYIDKTSSPKAWLQLLQDKKIKLSKYNIKRLHNLFKEYHEVR